jgi:hypothetical protein
MVEFARSVRGPGRVYFTGGATVIGRGLRQTTNDIDLSFDPEPRQAGETLRELKERLDINLELARPSDFIPELPGWEQRSLFIGRFGEVDFFDYDPYSQLLAKIERGHQQDLADARALVAEGLVDPSQLRALFLQVRERLLTDSAYVAVDPDAFEEKLRDFLHSLESSASARPL